MWLEFRRVLFRSKVVENEKSSKEEFKEEGSGNIDLDSMITKSPEKVIEKLRKFKKIFLKGKNILLNKMKLLIIEDERSENDYILSQILRQLKETDCILHYSTYNNVVEELKSQEYEFEVLLVVATTQMFDIMKLLTTIMKSINDSYYTQMPICVVSGNYIFYIEHSEQV